MNEHRQEIVLEARAVSKRYPGTLALDRVSFYVHRNKVNVLIGENGAGKSTLMRILAGVESADEGELLLEGAAIRLRSPREAAAHGISIVHQELSVLPNLDISENIFAGRELVKAGVLVDRASQHSRSADALRRLRKPMRTTSQAAHLSLGCRQIVEVARTLDQGAKVLILDEPTSALSTAEADSLFQVIDDLKSSGVTIIYISHRLHELLHLGDYFTVLRSGRVVGEAPREEVSRQWIVERMSGCADTSDLDARVPAADAAGMPLRKRTVARVFRLRRSCASSVAQYQSGSASRAKSSASTVCSAREGRSYSNRLRAQVDHCWRDTTLTAASLCADTNGCGRSRNRTRSRGSPARWTHSRR